MKYFADYVQCFEPDYKDVFLVPQYSELNSRKEANTSVELCRGINLDTPIISANMDTVTESAMCIALHKAGTLGVMHRFMSIDDNIREYMRVRGEGAECFVSIGVNGESKERASALYMAGARYFCIDIAHGHSKIMKEMIDWLRFSFKREIIIMAGNVATYNATLALVAWGVDIIKVGIGPGSVCITKNQTGVTFPQFSAVFQCAEAAKKFKKPIIADGGLIEYGDVAKAIAAGATAVMSGRFFAGTMEAPKVCEGSNQIYRGMASSGAMKRIKREEDMATPEGKAISLDPERPAVWAHQIVSELKGALQSSMSYTNARTIAEFQEKAVIGVRNV